MHYLASGSLSHIILKLFQWGSNIIVPINPWYHTEVMWVWESCQRIKSVHLGRDWETRKQCERITEKWKLRSQWYYRSSAFPGLVPKSRTKLVIELFILKFVFIRTMSFWYWFFLHCLTMWYKQCGILINGTIHLDSLRQTTWIKKKVS